MHLQSRRKGYSEKANSPFGAGAEGVGHEVSVVGTQQENLCHLGVRQMQSAKHGHIGPPVFGMIGIQDCDLHTRGGDGVDIKFMSALQKATRNSGRRRRAPTKSWHCIWLESAIRTLMGWAAVAHVGSMDPRGFFTFRTIERRVYGISCMGFCDISTFECAGNVENVAGTSTP